MHRILLSVLALLLVTSLASAQDEPSWPVGEFLLLDSLDPAEAFDCASAVTEGPVDLFLFARVDFRAIGRAELNGVDGMTGWKAALETVGCEVVEVELLTPGATDADDDVKRFDVTLAQPVLGSDEFQGAALARIRVTSESWGGSRMQVVGAGFEERPTWSAVGETDDCPAPCERRIKATSLAYGTFESGAPIWCFPDYCDLFLERPLGGETWIGRDEQTLLYSHTGGQYRLEYREVGAVDWQVITQNYATEDWFEWTVPNVSATVELRICNDCVGFLCSEPTRITIDRRVSDVPSSWGSVKARY